MYSIIKSINDETKLADCDGVLYILKKITLDEVELVKKLMGINCENVVKFYGTTAIDGDFYAVEEYINGVTLKAYVEKKGVLSDEDVGKIAVSVCNGLSAVHSLNIIHRDINPNNIMLDGYGVVKIIDFGISRTYKPEMRADTQILGTQGYAAPEQYGFSQTGAKADIYSLGVVINYMKTLSLPNEKRADGRFAPIVQRCTEIDENKRYNDVDEIIYDILYGYTKKPSRIPGFRQNVLWHKIVASVYYAFVILAFIAFSVPAGEEGNNPQDAVYWLTMIFFVFTVPVPICTDFLGWTRFLKFTKHLSEKEKRWVPIITGAVYTVTAFMVYIIIQ